MCPARSAPIAISPSPVAQERTWLNIFALYWLAGGARTSVKRDMAAIEAGASAPIVDRIAKSSVVVSKLEMHSKLARSAIALSNLPNPWKCDLGYQCVHGGFGRREGGLGWLRCPTNRVRLAYTRFSSRRWPGYYHDIFIFQTRL